INVSSTALRIGFRNTLLITFSNIGSVAAYNPTISLSLDESIIPLSSNIPWNTNNENTLTWNIDTLKQGEQTTIYLIDSVSINTSISTFKTISAQIENDLNGLPNDCDLTNNIATIYEETVGSVDPNDKQVFPKGYGPLGLITREDTLTYKIRFQNVGNYKASRVIVIDSLSEHLDFSSIHDVSLSHKGNYTIYENGVLNFTFIDIELPDSTSNEPESHGFVQFRVLPNLGAPEEAVILNKASIQFDYNQFIQTNTVLNTIVNSITNKKSLQLHIFPNPTKNYATVQVLAKDLQTLPIQLENLIVHDASGALVKNYPTNKSKVHINREGLKSGIYIIKGIDKNGFCYVSKWVILD
ncbi:MAG: T9SS type A sorting domain-containing protein, partial [Flavobacteriales bacterium]|nr:T9SS type A sorting domain-containing protein [Flavobacteriales bacterium]